MTPSTTDGCIGVRAADRPVPGSPAGDACAPLSLAARHIVFKAADGLSVRTILSIESIDLPAGARVAVTGSSGAGKTSLMRVLSGMVRPDTGSVRWGGTELTALSEPERDRWRGRFCGFLFQDFGLLDGLTALENVLLPETFHGAIQREARDRAQVLLERLGVPAGTRAANLSRGEMQRTALARLLMGRPKVIFADEPTASLDEANARRVMTALNEAADKLGAALIVVTHDDDIARSLPLRARMRQGRWSWLEGPDAQAAGGL